MIIHVNVLKTLSDTCEFGESLIRDRVVFGILHNSVRERLLRDPELFLQTAVEKVMSAELTNAQLKQIKADQRVTEEAIHNAKSNNEQTCKKREQNPPSSMVNCRYCGQKHPRDKNQCPAYREKCQKCGKYNNIFLVMCKSKLRRSPRVNYVEDDEATHEDEYTISTIRHHIGTLNTTKTNDSKIPKQLFATMKVYDSVNVKFQLDCGASCNLLPLQDYARVMGNPEGVYWQKSNAKLTMHNGPSCTP